jgi:arginine deiminase
VVGEIPDPGRLEGGDFFAVGDMGMIGIGLRSNIEAVQYMMDNDLLGYDRVVVVKDFLESSQDRMHLDTYFSILSNDCCVLLEDCIGEDSPTRRYVDEYRRNGDGSEYKLFKQDVEFSQWLKDEGYKYASSV